MVVLHKLDDIEQLGKELEGAPVLEAKEKKLTTTEAVALLAGTIRGMQEKGYSIAQIAERLTEKGLKISGATLKRCLTNIGKRGRSRHSRSGGRTRKKAPSATAGVAGGTPSDAGEGRSGVASGDTPGVKEPQRTAASEHSEDVRPGTFTPRGDTQDI